MTLFSGSIVFFISWWLVLLAVLPVGVRSQFEEGAPEDGTEPGAPVDHMLPKKALWATIGAAVVTFIGYLIGISGIIQPPEPPWG